MLCDKDQHKSFKKLLGYDRNNTDKDVACVGCKYCKGFPDKKNSKITHWVCDIMQPFCVMLVGKWHTCKRFIKNEQDKE